MIHARHSGERERARRSASVPCVRTIAGGKTIIGIARYAVTNDAGTAEVGIAVADAWQRRAVRRLMLEQLMRFASSRGIHRFTGIGLPDNDPMIGFAQALGFEIHLDLAQHLLTICRNLADFKECVDRVPST